MRQIEGYIVITPSDQIWDYARRGPFYYDEDTALEAADLANRMTLNELGYEAVPVVIIQRKDK